MTTKTKRTSGLKAEDVKREADGRWLDILEIVGGYPRENLNRRHRPCPVCGGVDRFRLIDPNAGAVHCNWNMTATTQPTLPHAIRILWLQ
jgi:phage/plasmid primase-like uncharacterized protein